MAGCWDQLDSDPGLAEATSMNDKIWRAYRKTAVTMAQQQTGDFTVETIHGQVQALAGDYLCVGPGGDQWPCAKEIFEATYEQLEDTVELPAGELDPRLPDPTTGPP